MVILVSLLLSVLLVCDVILIKYCHVKRPFSLFAFSFLIVLLALVSLIITGDIFVACGN